MSCGDVVVATGRQLNLMLSVEVWLAIAGEIVTLSASTIAVTYATAFDLVTFKTKSPTLLAVPIPVSVILVVFVHESADATFVYARVNVAVA